ncbi:MAG: hypothetical protein M3N48_08110 [Verrucomicrobiota bacterium]|nr:hypothetical protein [Verrucomicrobiota bacterium]
MKKLVIPALLVLVGACLFTSCTTVPHDPNTTVPRDNSTSTTRTYSK